MSAKAYVTLVLIISIFLVLVLGTAAWFVANTDVGTERVTVTAANTIGLTLTVPSSQLNADSYVGQTGIQYGGMDSPYELEYRPLRINAKTLGDGEYYMVFRLPHVRIKPVVAGAPEKDLSPAEISRNFTWRVGVKDGDDTVIYKGSNGYLVNENTGELFRVRDGLTYTFTLYIYFLGEEGYSLMQATQADIHPKYTFEYSDVSYIWATFYLSIAVGISELNTVTFDSAGGFYCPAIKTTGGEVVDLPVPEHPDPGKVFLGWYLDPAGEGVRFMPDTMLKSPRSDDFTLYAKWGEANP